MAIITTIDPAILRVDVTGWFPAKILDNVASSVMNNNSYYTEYFDNWIKTCCGMVVLQQSDPIIEDGYINLPKWYVYFELEEDYVRYNLTFDEIKPRGDSAAFYCPYIPLTYSNVSIAGQICSSPPIVKFVSRYDNADENE